MNIIVIIIAIFHLLILFKVIKEKSSWFLFVYASICSFGFLIELVWSTISYSDNKFVFINFAFLFSRFYLMLPAYLFGN